MLKLHLHCIFTNRIVCTNLFIFRLFKHCFMVNGKLVRNRIENKHDKNGKLEKER